MGTLRFYKDQRHYIHLSPFISYSGSLVRPKVVRSVHYCPATKKTMERKYTDMTSLDAFPSSAIYPTKVGSSFYLSTNNCVFVLRLHRFIKTKDNGGQITET